MAYGTPVGVDIFGVGSWTSTFTVVGNGYGSNLPVRIKFGQDKFPSKFAVSFVKPTIDKVEALVDGAASQMASSVIPTTINVYGSNLGVSAVGGEFATIAVTSADAPQDNLCDS